ncbi:GntR family transcriptional regulator [Nonomuraea fastidiosa]|uniref:GntR family transcriptional regulator n=1 Tax=Nonomuraea fastidiosa TaxID=46173 RepID=UPI00366C62D8
MARHHKIADDIKAKILDGTYPVGSILPGNRDLQLIYGAASGTIYNAIQNLKAEQLIRLSVGEGMEVLPPPTVVDLILHGDHGHGPLPWAKCCERSGVDGAMVTGKVTTSTASPDVAELLGINEGDEVVIRNRRAIAGLSVVRVDQAIYPLELVRDTPLTQQGQVQGGVYRALADADMEPYAIARRIISTRLATDAEAKTMKLVKRSMLLTYDQVIIDREGRRIELLRFAANPARVRFVDEEMPL